MQTMKQAVAEFLAGTRVAVTGVSRNRRDMAATRSTSGCGNGAMRFSR
jgi:hypothetical protein